MPDEAIADTLSDAAASAPDYAEVVDAIGQSANSLLDAFSDVQMLLVVGIALLFLAIGVLLASIIANTLRG